MSGQSGDYPRVLIVGLDFTGDKGGGITLSCLFKGWPRERLAVAAGDQDLGASGFAGCYYRLGSLEDRWVWPLSAIPRERWKVSGSVIPGARGVAESENSPGDRRSAPSPRSDRHLASLTRRIGHAALRVTGSNDLLQCLYLSHPFLAWVAAFRPDIIYSPLASLGRVRLVGALARETGIPLALHFMDDWPSTLYRNGLVAPILRAKLVHELAELIEQAALLVAISDDMSQEFRARYGRNFLTFHNALELGDWARVRRNSWGAGRPFEVLFAGSIGMANEDSIRDVAQAIGSLAGAGMNIRFMILTPDGALSSASQLKRLAHVDLLPPISHAEIPARLAAADLLVLPLDFREEARQFARFSMPTKAVEYMASGSPTIVYAPATSAVSRYAKAQGWGKVVGRRNVQDLAAGIRSLADSAEQRERLAKRAMEVAMARHDADVVSDAFRSALELASTAPGSQGSASARPCRPITG